MQYQPTFIRQRLVLLGGGHTHVQVIEHLIRQPLDDVEVVLVSKDIHTPYSGMLPGLVAGHYYFDACHIDLARLARKAGIKFIADPAVGLDADAQRVEFAARPALYYDLLSINLGSTPDLRVTGAAEHAVGVKPIDALLPKLDALITSYQKADAANEELPITVVGGGAAGVEMAMALRYRLEKEGLAKDTIKQPLRLIASSGVLPSASRKVREKIQSQLQQQSIQVINARVSEVSAQQIALTSGQTLPSRFTLWATGATAKSWLADTSLATNEAGFITLKPTLQSTSHANVFAAGDVATVQAHPRPKAGVFAVRQGPPLTQNLIRYLRGQPLQAYKPQSSFLTLLACGGQYAVGGRGGFAFAGHWVWRWKDKIDRQFMARFAVAAMRTNATHSNRLDDVENAADEAVMRCQGCGGKIAGDVLQSALDLSPQAAGAGSIQLADMASLQLGEQRVWQSVDFFTDALADDYRLGQLIAIHAVNDSLASGFAPQAALSTIGLPAAAAQIQSDRIRHLVAGMNAQLAQWGIQVSGGHSAETWQTQVGLIVTATQQRSGSLMPRQQWQKSGAQVGDRIIVTQPLGSGLLLAGLTNFAAQGRWLEAWFQQISQPRAAGYERAQQAKVSAATDISGYGLLGHLREILQASQSADKSEMSDVTLGAEIIYAQVPVFAGTKTLAKQGIRSSIHPQNVAYAKANIQTSETLAAEAILHDPQTAGGLVLIMPAPEAASFVAEGFGCDIGHIINGNQLVVR